jgi:PAS domain S-box-containing protein
VLWTIDLAGNVTSISPAIANLLGYKPEEVIGYNISRFLTLNSYASAFRMIVDRKVDIKDWGKPAVNKHVLESVTKNGSKKWIEIISYPVLDSNNNLTGFTGICRDVSERINTENLLREKENRLNDLINTKDKFFSIIAHDLRIPFNGILGFLDLLDNQFEEINDSEKRMFIKLIAENAQNTLALLENLLEWSKSQTGKHSFQPINQKLKPAIENVVNTLTPTLSLKKLAIGLNVADELEIYADSRMLTTIFHNLIGNAIKYSYEDGKIEIFASRKNSEIEMTISDGGIGMAKDVSRVLFKIDEHFSTPGTSNEKGSGLGLILCKDFIEMHNGKIWVESKPGRGSRFTFTIPDKI